MIKTKDGLELTYKHLFFYILLIIGILILIVLLMNNANKYNSIVESQLNTYSNDYYNIADNHCKSLFKDSIVLDTYVINSYDCGDLRFFCVDTNGTLHYTKLPDKLTRKCLFERGNDERDK